MVFVSSTTTAHTYDVRGNHSFHHCGKAGHNYGVGLYLTDRVLGTYMDATKISVWGVEVPGYIP